MKKVTGITIAGSFAALGVATCCILPMTFMLFGLGGSWLAVFGKIAAASTPVLVGSSALVALAWLLALRHGRLAGLAPWLAASTVVTAAAWVVFLNEARLNDFLIKQM